MKFKKNIKILEDKLIIEVSCGKQVYSSENRFVFEEDIWSLVPDELREKAKLISSPQKQVSNVNRQKYTTFGRWEFLIEEKQKSSVKIQAKKPRRSRTQNRK
tara:strand:+ start:2718 stop:3023 length:306 start_codon:yes stop_codon:yes gene_type:complete